VCLCVCVGGGGGVLVMETLMSGGRGGTACAVIVRHINPKPLTVYASYNPTVPQFFGSICYT
jgi:hypothetical protein